MTTVYAYSTIRHGLPDGTVVEFQPGDKLDVNVLGKERVAYFLESGHAATYDVTKPQDEAAAEAEASQAELQAKVADLEAKLAEATRRAEGAEKASASAAKSSSGSGSR